MAKYAILNCWSDYNKGDLGIMIATIEEIRRQDQNSEIIGISSFREDDPMFRSDHRILEKYVDRLYPSLNGILGVNIFGRMHKGIIAKIIALFLETIRLELILLLPNTISKTLLTKKENKILNIIHSCDVALSKGGTVFTDYDSFRGKIGLYRICHLFRLLKKFNIPYFIMGQSFGPISVGNGSIMVNHIIENAEKVYLRELTCVNNYPHLILNNYNVFFSNDTAFLLQPQKPRKYSINENRVNIGVTLRPVDNDVINYINVIVNVMCHLVSEKNVDVHVFQQVSMSDEPDNNTAHQIINLLPESCIKHVFYHTESLDPQELCWMYSKMRFLIGSRLHSTIFSMAAGTPAIGLAYHGTKTQGIFKTIGVSELVIEAPLNQNGLLEKICYVNDNYDKIKETIYRGVEQAKQDTRQAINSVVSFANDRVQPYTEE